MPWDADTAYALDAQWMAESLDGTLYGFTAGGSATDPASWAVKVVRGDISKSPWRRLAQAFMAAPNAVPFHVFSNGSGAGIANHHSQLVVGGVTYLVTAIDQGRFGAEQLLACIEAAENG